MTYREESGLLYDTETGLYGFLVEDEAEALRIQDEFRENASVDVKQTEPYSSRWVVWYRRSLEYELIKRAFPKYVIVYSDNHCMAKVKTTSSNRGFCMQQLKSGSTDFDLFDSVGKASAVLDRAFRGDKNLIQRYAIASVDCIYDQGTLTLANPLNVRFQPFLNYNRRNYHVN